MRNEIINPPIHSSNINKILLLRTDRIGNMAVSIPLIRSLKKELPNLSIYVFASSGNAPLIVGDPDISGVFIKPKNIYSTFVQLLKIRSEAFDLSLNLNLNMSLTNAFLSHISVPNGMKVASTYNDRYSNFYNYLMDIKRNNKTPMALLLLKYLELFGIEGVEVTNNFSICRSASAEETASEILGELELDNIKFFVFNISSAHKNRNTTDNFVIELILGLFKRTGEPILLMSDPAQRNRLQNISDTINNNRLMIAPVMDLQTLTAVIRKSELVITPDTAIVHIACGVNIPVAAFYTREEKYHNEWQPIGVKSVSIFANESSHVSEIDPLDALEKIIELYTDIYVNE